MSHWNHAICILCWYKREPERQPVRVREADEEPCCFCGKQTTEGIYVRQAHEEVHPPPPDDNIPF